MIATISGTVLTIILDPLFLFGFHWGASGVAFANVLGYAVNTSLLVFFMRRAKTLSLAPKLAHISRPTLKAVVAVGIPASLTNLTQSFGMMILNSYLAAYGGHGNCSKSLHGRYDGHGRLCFWGPAFSWLHVRC